MNEAIELHDSTLAAVSFSGDSAVVSFAPAYLHRCRGEFGSGTHSVWLVPATLTFAGVSPVALPGGLPVSVSGGFLRVGETIHDNLIPSSGSFEGTVEFSVVLTAAETLTIRGRRVSIQLLGEPSYLEEFIP